MFRQLKRRIYNISYGKASFIIVVFSIVYLEIIAFYLNKRNWNYLQCVDKNNCVKILLVADPQIIGHDGEYLTPLTVYDSDNFIRKTYFHAFHYVKPNVTIFLGDLMDEGSTATDEEYYSYIERFFNIFPDHILDTMQIWLPGDNDIGGEGRDLVTPHKLKRFDFAFSQPDAMDVGKFKFFKINRIIQKMPKYESKRNFYDTSRVFIGLSHIPLMFIPSLYVDKILNKMQPHVLFTAHEHKSMIVTTDGLLKQDRQIIPITQKDNLIMQFTLGESDMYEIIVPTCSYRMGTEKIGFGYAVIENNKLSYTVLWSPSRLVLLLNYIYVILILFLIWMVKWCKK